MLFVGDESDPLAENDEARLVWMISEVPSAVEISPAFTYIYL